MMMTRWAAGTPEHFLIHVRRMIHAIKEMELDTKFKETIDAVENVTLGLEISKMEYKN